MDRRTHPGRRGFLLGGRTAADEQPVRLVAVIARDCLAFRGIACMSCRDACPTGAIRFSLARGGAIPRVEEHACTGCGDCAAVCPASAISTAPAEAGKPADG